MASCDASHNQTLSVDNTPIHPDDATIETDEWWVPIAAKPISNSADVEAKEKRNTTKKTPKPIRISRSTDVIMKQLHMKSKRLPMIPIARHEKSQKIVSIVRFGGVPRILDIHELRSSDIRDAYLCTLELYESCVTTFDSDGSWLYVTFPNGMRVNRIAGMDVANECDLLEKHLRIIGYEYKHPGYLRAPNGETQNPGQMAWTAKRFRENQSNSILIHKISTASKAFSIEIDGEQCSMHVIPACCRTCPDNTRIYAMSAVTLHNICAESITSENAYIMMIPHQSIDEYAIHFSEAEHDICKVIPGQVARHADIYLGPIYKIPIRQAMETSHGVAIVFIAIHVPRHPFLSI